MKTYLKDLTPEEIIKRLKNGEIVKIEDSKEYFKMIDGIVCRFYDYGDVGIGCSIFKEPDDVYFETEEPFEIKETGVYKTRDGKKVFVSFIAGDGRKYPVCGVICGEALTSTWDTNGRIITDIQNNQDIIGKWED